MLDEVTADEWESLRERAVQSTIYHSASWGTVWSRAFRWGTPRYFVHRPHDEARALVPLYEKYDKYVSVLGCEYGGILPLDKNASFNIVLAGIRESLEKPIDIRFHPLLGDEFDTPPAYTEITHLHTYLLNVQREPEDILSSFRNTTRHAIEGALDSSLTVEKEGSALVDEFYEPYLSSIKHNSAVPYPRQFYRALTAELSGDTWDIYLARDEGQVVSTILVTHHDGFSHYFKAGNTPTGYEKDANPLLVWNAILDAHERGVDYFDFGATPEGTGLDTFKRGWRGEKHPIRVFTTRHTEGPNSDESMLQDLWGRLPPRAMEWLSPYALWFTA